MMVYYLHVILGLANYMKGKVDLKLCFATWQYAKDVSVISRMKSTQGRK